MTWHAIKTLPINSNDTEKSTMYFCQLNMCLSLLKKNPEIDRKLTV